MAPRKSTNTRIAGNPSWEGLRPRQPWFVAKIFFALVLILLVGCHRAAPPVLGALPQRGYLWQRAWSPAVAAAVKETENRMDGMVILGAEIVWKGGSPETIRSTID
jgi:hypothetical protein